MILESSTYRALNPECLETSILPRSSTVSDSAFWIVTDSWKCARFQNGHFGKCQSGSFGVGVEDGEVSWQKLGDATVRVIDDTGQNVRW
jgi:hypothetical protein